MTTIRRASELILAADLSCSGTFSAIGVVREPSFALSVAVRDLLLYREDPELIPVIIHVLATRVAGLCSITGAQIGRALAELHGDPNCPGVEHNNSHNRNLARTFSGDTA